MSDTLFVIEEDVSQHPDGSSVTHLDRKKVFAWSDAARAYWQEHGPAPSCWPYRNFPYIRVGISRRMPFLDYFHCGSFSLVSKRLRNILHETLSTGEIEFHPAKVIRGFFSQRDYFVCNVLAASNPIDMPVSQITYFPPEAGGGIMHFEDVRVKTDFVPSHELFAVEDYESMIVMTSSMKRKLVASGISGVRYVPLEGYNWLRRTRDGEQSA